MKGNGDLQKTASTLRRHKRELRERYHVLRIGVFGSVARGSQRPGSDLDVFIEFERPIGLAFFALWDLLEKLLGRKVDIVTKGGLDSLRVKSVAKEIKKSLVYV
ncbi:MAG: nucleotidyltransferase family protein [Deltaproteobacteria bacterium]|nr:nucleotidyltransferase family protein [Deltaproteobacteria bacterium]